jgi:glycerol-3-phosphate dehydrogenase (NAD(P)+)
MELKSHKRITILGAGNFGTCLAQLYATKGYDVLLWGIFEEVAEHINRHHRNPEYLTGFNLSEKIRAVCGIEPDVVRSSDAVVLAVPTQVLREVLSAWKGLIDDNKLLICAAKGIEEQTLCLPISIISAVLGQAYGEKTVFISGPSFAVEIMAGQPTCVSLAGHDKERCLAAQKMSHTPLFRCYTSDDPVGLEIAGALKNVIAIAAGAAAGLGYQENSRAALLTRGLAEMTRIGLALGANPITFNGLGGVGDLFLTCTSQKSRNFTVGYRLGKGEKLDDIVKSVGSVAEGVTTAKAAFGLATRLGVDAPIINEVYAVLYQGKDIQDTINYLLNREPKPEIT